MTKGSYRGGSTLTGWNANGYVSPSSKLKGKGRTAQSRGESAAGDEAARRKHGLAPRKPDLRKPDLRAKEQAKVEQKQNLRKTSRTSAPVVVKLKRRKPASRVGVARRVSRASAP
jgi:hypothetical protein